MLVTFDNWINGREIAALGTNAGAQALPFQGWRHFKEAFAPELVARAVRESEISVKRCVDPFSGSGTTALACQFLGVHPTFIEVNPYLADLAEAKVSTYDIPALTRDFAKLVRRANAVSKAAKIVFAGAPVTLIEPGRNDRWIFDRVVAERLAAYRIALKTIRDQNNRRLFRVLLGGIVVDVSNVVVSGKGRRYRRNWEAQRKTARDLDEAFCSSVEVAVGDIVRHGARPEMSYSILRGDCRDVLRRRVKPFDLAVFSPPYPNSFDYTDVYNVELWALGYLKTQVANARLRSSTLSSHVQIRRDFPPAPEGSSKLKTTMKNLREVRDQLWDHSIPEMVGGYFADMTVVINSLWKRLREALNSGERSFWDFVQFLPRANRFKKFLTEANPDVGLVKSYQDEVTQKSWVETLPGKSIRFIVAAGTGLAASSVVGPLGGLAVGATNTFILDRLLKGWRPNRFIHGPYKRFVLPE